MKLNRSTHLIVGILIVQLAIIVYGQQEGLPETTTRIPDIKDEKEQDLEVRLESCNRQNVICDLANKLTHKQITELKKLIYDIGRTATCEDRSKFCSCREKQQGLKVSAVVVDKNLAEELKLAKPGSLLGDVAAISSSHNYSLAEKIRQLWRFSQCGNDLTITISADDPSVNVSLGPTAKNILEGRSVQAIANVQKLREGSFVNGNSTGDHFAYLREAIKALASAYEEEEWGTVWYMWKKEPFAIVYSIIYATILVLIIIGVICYCSKKKQRQSDSNDEKTEETKDTEPEKEKLNNETELNNVEA